MEFLVDSKVATFVSKADILSWTACHCSAVIVRVSLPLLILVSPLSATDTPNNSASKTLTDLNAVFGVVSVTSPSITPSTLPSSPTKNLYYEYLFTDITIDSIVK